MTFFIHITPEDLVETRFAFSPMWEVVTSFRVLQNPNRHALYLNWINEAREVLPKLSLPYMQAVIQEQGYFPDFLTPTPTITKPTMDAELKKILETKPHHIQKDIELLLPSDNPHLLAFQKTPQEAIKQLVDEIQQYWEGLLAHHWMRMRTVLEGDVLYRARQLALSGAESLFANLHPSITYNAANSTIEISKKFDQRLQLKGDGLLLVPVIFSWPDLYILPIPKYHPTIGYSARGAGLWRYEPPNPSEALELTLGTGRARVLKQLSTPITTSELAQKLKITAGAVSQHISRLNAAGLVEPMQNGKHVYHHLTERGEKLLDVFTEH